MTKLNLLVKSSAIVFGVFLFISSASSVNAADFIEGTGTHFEIQDSQYLDVALDSSEEVKVRLDSVPQMILLNIESTTLATSTNIIFSGLEPNHTYYKYQDDYHNLTEMVSDALGNYSYTQDISTPHFIFIQPTPSTKFISDNATGGDCTTIGTWNVSTKTCTLTGNINQTIQIDNNGITLDGAGYTNTGSNTGFGVYVFQKSNVTVQNLRSYRFEVGIYLNQANNIIITGNNITSSWYAISIIGSNITIEENSLTSDIGGINITGSSNLIRNNNVLYARFGGSGIVINGTNNILRNNSIQVRGESASYDMFMQVTADSQCNNTIEDNIGSGDLPIQYINSNTTFADQTVSHLILCNADGATVRNVQIQSPGRQNGILIFNTDNATIENVNSSDNNRGIYASQSTYNIFRNNVFHNNSTHGIALYYSSINNEIIANSIEGVSEGIWLSNSSNNNTAHDNYIANNSYGIIILSPSAGNTIYNNNFVQNTTQIYGEGSNIFNLAAPTGGNYWSNYDTPAEGCNNANNDNFCDAPYTFSGGQDNLPWVNQSGWAPVPTVENIRQFKSDGVTEVQEGQSVVDTEMRFKATVISPLNNQVKLQVELRQMNEDFLEYDSNDGGFRTSDPVNSGLVATVTRPGLIDGQYKWRARAVDATNSNNVSDWVQFGTTDPDFIVNHVIDVAVILAETSDVPHNGFPIIAQPCKLLPPKIYFSGHNKEYVEDLVYCVTNYYLENSYNKLNLQFTIFDKNNEWYKLPFPHTESSYVGHDEQFVKDAVDIASGNIVIEDYNIVIAVHAGSSRQLTNDINKIGTGALLPPGLLVPVPPWQIVIAENDSMGVWAHEIGHISGELLIDSPNNTAVPDFYYDAAHPTSTNLSTWDLMAEGAHNGDGGNPPFMSSYIREFLGWLTYEGNTHSKGDYGNHWIDSLDSSDFGDSVFRYNLDFSSSTSTQKYYLLEARNKNLKIWDSSLPEDKSLILYYVDEKNKLEYGYDLVTHLPINQYRIVQIPGLTTQNDGVLNPEQHEAYQDFDNLLRFRALSDELSDNKYRILSSITPIIAPDLPNRFFATVLQSKAKLSESLGSNRLGLPTRDINFTGVIKQIYQRDDLSDKPYVFTIKISASSIKKDYTTGKAPFLTEQTLDFVVASDVPVSVLGYDPREFKVNDKVSGIIVESVSDLIVPNTTSLGINYGLYYLEKTESIERGVSLEKSIKIISALALIFFIAETFVLLYLQKIHKIKKQKLFKIWLILLFIVLISVFIISFEEMRVLEKNSLRIFNNISKNPALMNTPPLVNGLGITPDLDLHVYTDSGLHVGVNYETSEYENQISGAITNGDMQNAPEWILIPDTVTNYHYVVSSEDNQRFLEANPDIAAQLTDVSDGYNVYARVFDPQAGIFTSQTVENQSIEPGETISHVVVGNNETISIEQGVIDIAGPTITHSSVNSQYNLNASPFTFTYSAEDTLSGLKTVSATLDGNAIVSGNNIALTQPGTHTIVITAEDNAGNITTETINFTVAYIFGGYLVPIKTDGTGIYNLNRTLPIRFELTDANSQIVTSALAQLYLAKIQEGIVGTDEIPLSNSNADTGNNFRVEGNHYIYNLDTNTLSVGTWQVKAVLDDGTNYTVVISIQ